VGTLRLITAWPFPGEEIEKMARKAKHVIVLENNLGQMFHYVQAAAAGRARVSFLRPRILGELHEVEDILTAAANGYGQVSQGPIPRDLYPHDPNVPQYTYDLAEAKRLLIEAGYPDGGFKLLMTYSSEDAFGSKFAPLVKEAFAKVGVTVDLQPLLFEQQWAKAKGPVKDRQDLFELIWWPGFPDGYDSLYSLFHTEADPSQPVWNLSYWSNKSYDTAVDTAYSDEATDPAKAQELYNQAQEMLYEQAPAAYLFDPDKVYGLSPSLKLQPTALNVNYTSVFYWYRVSE
jgi:peptide/nickel transport system substrate-binding protein